MYLSPRWIIYLGMALVLCTLVFNIIEEINPVSADVLTIFTVVQSFQKFTSVDTSGSISLAVAIGPNVFDLIMKMLWWDYNCLHNFAGFIFRALMICVSFAILLSLTLIFIKR
jgi:hypothetical protein